MRLGFVNTFYEPYVGGGAEITLRSIVQGLSERGHECEVITSSAPGQVSLDEVDGIPVTRIPIQNAYWPYGGKHESLGQRLLWHWKDRWNVRMRIAAEKVLLALNVDLVFLHNLSGFSSAVWQVGRRLNLPVIQVLHDHYSICPRSIMFSKGERCKRQCLACKFFRRRHPMASNELSAVVGVSHAVLNNHLRYNYFRDVVIRRVIYNAREVPLLAPKPIRGQLFRFGFIGTLSAPKGLEQLLSAFDGVCRRTERNVELLVAGTGNIKYVAKLKSRYANPRIRFLGRMVPAEFFQMINVSVVPSICEEALGNVVFESLGFGVPVIGNALGGIPEMIQHGVNGVLLSPEQCRPELEEVMLTMLNNPKMVEAFAANARASVPLFLNPARQIDEYETLIEDVLANHE